MAGLVRDRRFETTFIVAPVGGGWLCEYITASPGKIASGGIFLSSSLSLSSTPSLSLFSLPPFYFATHSTLPRICAPFYRYFKSSWNSINLSTLLIRARRRARECTIVRESRAIFSFHSLLSNLLRYLERSVRILSILLSSPFFPFFRIVCFSFFSFLLDFESSFVELWWMEISTRMMEISLRSDRARMEMITNRGSIRPPSRVKGRSVIMYTSQTSG